MVEAHQKEEQRNNRYGDIMDINRSRCMDSKTAKGSFLGKL